MSKPKQQWELDEFDGAGQPLARLMEEINILRLEGSLFCPDPREAKRRTRRFAINELSERPVAIEP